jgi:hypothetical protein
MISRKDAKAQGKEQVSSLGPGDLARIIFLSSTSAGAKAARKPVKF